MLPRFTPADLDAARSRDLLPLECEHCHKTFHRRKHQIQAAIKPDGQRALHCCSKACQSARQRKERHVFQCAHCGGEVLRRDADLTSRRTKGLRHHFCSQRCSGFHNAQHRTKGTRRAKLEVWLEQQLPFRYPGLPILFNDTSAIRAELDLYFPTLQLAVELNGVFHYEPIFGPEKLAHIQSNDQRKLQACAERGIAFCTIDTSAMRYFKPARAEQYLQIITGLVDRRLAEVGARAQQGAA